MVESGDIFQCISLNNKFYMLIIIYIKYVSGGTIDNGINFGLGNILAMSRRKAIIETNIDQRSAA